MDEVYKRLSELLLKHAQNLEITQQESGYLYVNTGKQDAKGKPTFFGMVKQSKSKVAFHLMSLYCNPELLKHTSEQLKKKLSGKSCFNFNKVDEILFSELNELTEAALQDYINEGKTKQ